MVKSTDAAAAQTKSLPKRIAKFWWVYIFLAPGVIYLLFFNYYPMYGIVLAFKDYLVKEGIMGSPWSIPFYKHFIALYNDNQFGAVFFNTFRMGLGYILTSFPAPIILALMLNELRIGKYKKVLQTVYTFPNFLSWVIIGGVMVSFLSTDGLVNSLVKQLGGQSVSFLTNSSSIRPIMYGTNVWKTAGWSAIMYLAAIAGINPELYEAASIDGAGRFARMYHITLPGIRPTATIILILAFAGILNNGFDQILNMTNPVVRPSVEIIDTYIYQKTFASTPNYGFSTAVGLSKSVINLVFLLLANKITKLFGGDGIV